MSGRTLFTGGHYSLRHRHAVVPPLSLAFPVRCAFTYNLLGECRALWGERERKVIFGACGYCEVAGIYKIVSSVYDDIGFLTRNASTNRGDHEKVVINSPTPLRPKVIIGVGPVVKKYVE